MYTRILVPLEGSTVAEGALVHAASVADQFGAELHLFRAVFLAQMPVPDLAEARRVLVQESEAYLDDVAHRLRRPGRPVHTIVRWGKAAESIIDYAVEQDISLVVMATQGHSSLEQWPMGSIAEKVLRSMQVPVLLVREPQSPL